MERVELQRRASGVPRDLPKSLPYGAGDLSWVKMPALGRFGLGTLFQRLTACSVQSLWLISHLDAPGFGSPVLAAPFSAGFKELVPPLPPPRVQN